MVSLYPSLPQPEQSPTVSVALAKNREFDGVVVLWPYAVGGDAEQKRRLLYNAVTRAKRWCLVLLQGAQLRRQPPFA
jgi:DNA helicase IV